MRITYQALQQQDGPIPSCPEDAVLGYARGGHLICAGARDDATYTLHTQDCDYLLGVGAYDAGHWSAYRCAMPVQASPNTAIVGPAGIDPLTIGLPAALLVSAIIHTVRTLRK